MHPREIKIQDYTYDLPDDRIAKYPLEERDASRLLIYKDEVITEDTYRNIAHHIPAGSLMFFNQTKVVHARLLFKKPSGGGIEVFCLAPAGQYKDIQTAMLQKKSVQWECLIGGAGKWKHGMVLELKSADPEFTLYASISGKTATAYVVTLEWHEDLTFAEVLHHVGKVPLPPYLHRDAEVADKTRYQTVFAREEGSVAAPTAGLHFTDEVFKTFTEKNIATAFVTLHVGAGTFKPVKSETMEAHEMHDEWIEVTREAIEKLKNQIAAPKSPTPNSQPLIPDSQSPIPNSQFPVVAVGTTSLRTLESLYWIGNKLANGEVLDLHNITVSQWDPYDDKPTVDTNVALQALLDFMAANDLARLVTRTQILIAPGYTFRIASALVTNFHQPQSTLLLLVAAFIGADWRRVYKYALDNNYRFLSYGDGSLLWKITHK